MINFKIIPLAIFLATYLLKIHVACALIGINWGRQNAQKLLPSNVVDLILQNGIHDARIFTTEEELLRAFAGTGINLTIDIPLMKYSSVQSIEQAKIWVQSRKIHFTPSNVRQIFVADYIFTSMAFNKMAINGAIQAAQSLQQALNDEGYGDQIKVTIPHHRGVLKFNKTSLRPSEAEFVDEIKPEMTTLVRFLQQNNAPFVFAITTIGDIQDFGVDFNFAFADNKSNIVIRDVNDAVYTNAFEIVYDAFIWALKKLNASDLRVIVGEVGWPTDGTPGASSSNAQRFYKGLLPWVSSNRGTPMRPLAPIDIYIQSLTDENKMMYFGNATFSRHWGIYMSNGKPKYQIDLSGQGRDDNIYPVRSKGIMRMPNRWCVFNGDKTNLTKLRTQVTKACTVADCTTMAPGGSCSQLEFTQNVTYAFNMYFQFQFQNETECDFEGLAHVSTDDPSTQECTFPIEVVKPEPLGSPMVAGKGFQEKPNFPVYVILIPILGTLFWN